MFGAVVVWLILRESQAAAPPGVEVRDRVRVAGKREPCPATRALELLGAVCW